MCKTHNHQWGKCISNQKPPYIPMEPYLQQHCQRHIQEYISWNRNRYKPEKSTTGMLLLSLLRDRSCQNVMKRPQGFVFTVQRMVTCTYHLNLPAAISIYWWKHQARHYCAYANRRSCLFCLRAPHFTLLHSCVSFFRKKLQECVAANSVQALIHLLPILL